MAAENAHVEDGDTIAIWGCGPVGPFAIRSALMMGAGRLIAIDEVHERLAMAEAGGAEGRQAPDRAAMNKGLTFKMGQIHVQAYTRPLLEKIEAGKLDPSVVITNTTSLKEAPEMHKKFRDKETGVIKVVLRPGS